MRRATLRAFCLGSETRAAFENVGPAPRTAVDIFRKKGITMRLTQQGERFDLVSSQGSVNVRQVIVDRKTGVNYLLASSSLTSGCGLTVLVDAEGRPIVTPVD